MTVFRCTGLSGRVRLTPCRRSLYSRTGVWPEKLTSAVRRDLELYWKEQFGLSNPLTSRNREGSVGGGPKYYCLPMFPYPSGSLHVGHAKIFSLSNAVSIFQHLRGKKVIHPIGWDSFGLPAENAAMEHHVPAAEWTESNIIKMKQQLDDVGFFFSWNRELATHHSNYYKWTQWLFLQLYKKGLAYQAFNLVNWDAVDKTVLANEQIDPEGKAWRSGAKVEKVAMKSWFVRTTALAWELQNELKVGLPGWPKRWKVEQKNWIGECNGTNVLFGVCRRNTSSGESTRLGPPGSGYGLCDMEDLVTIEVWTSTPQRLTTLVRIQLHPSHQLPKLLDDMADFRAVNPFTGSEIPFEICPADHSKFPEGCLAQLVFGDESESTGADQRDGDSGVQFRAACVSLVEMKAGGYVSSSNLKDWPVSRQRYWGTPIPLIHCQKCGTVPVHDLPVELPSVTEETFKGQSPLELMDSWKRTRCPRCGGDAVRECDTMDTYFDSSWYYLRYCSPHNADHAWDSPLNFMPVDLYVGGREHLAVHMFFARFIMRFLWHEGLVDQPEPFKKILMAGVIEGKGLLERSTGRWLTEEQVVELDPAQSARSNECNRTTGELSVSTGKSKHVSSKKSVYEERVRNLIAKDTGLQVDEVWEKMSKSKYNGIAPESVIEGYGRDVLMTYALYRLPPELIKRWHTTDILGILRWKTRYWMLLTRYRHVVSRDCETVIPEAGENAAQLESEFRRLERVRRERVSQITVVYEKSLQFYKAIEACQRFAAELKSFDDQIVRTDEYKAALCDFIITTSPFMPFQASEMWRGMGYTRDLFDQSWPIAT